MSTRCYYPSQLSGECCALSQGQEVKCTIRGLTTGTQDCPHLFDLVEEHGMLLLG